MNNIAEQLISLNNNLGTMSDLITQIKDAANSLPDIGGDSNSGTLEIFGDYLICSDPSFYVVPEEDTIINLDGLQTKVIFADDSNCTYWGFVKYIRFNSDGHILIIEEDECGLIEFNGDEWQCCYRDGTDMYYHPWDWQHSPVSFQTPVEVSQKEYNLLKGLFTYEDSTAYDIGYTLGYQVGEQVLLNELMEWAVLTDSTECIVEVYNYHSTKYLIATISVTNTWGDEFQETICIEPGSGNGSYFDATNQGTATWEVYINEVRFSEDEI